MSSYPERRRLRLANYDYSEPGLYFVTLCTEGRRSLFGTVEDGEMHLSVLGEKVRDTWTGFPRYAPGIRMDEHVIMPNHLHGIVCIESPDDHAGESLDGGVTGTSSPVTPDELQRPSVPQVMQQFKSYTTKLYLRGLPAHETEIARALWQRGYHDRVIRNERELAAIRQYIANNPLQWHLDRENPEFAPVSRPRSTHPG